MARSREYEPNEIIVDRGVELWIRALSAPRYNNGDDSPRGGFAGVLADMLPKNNNLEVLTAFGVALKKRLMTRQNATADYQGRYESMLDVDYHPDKILAEAAEEAGLKMQFPWKTSMYLYDDHVGFSQGYGGSRINHYPLSGDRWLITDLRGGDMAKIIKIIEETGENLGLIIEEKIDEDAMNNAWTGWEDSEKGRD